MAQLIVRNLEESVKRQLQRRAKRHGHSTEEEVRDILRNAVRSEEASSAAFGTRLKLRFAGIGLEEDVVELRGGKPRPATLDR
jgi:plasmid stability protein